LPRNALQAVAFLLGFWTALWLSPLTLRIASAETDFEGFPNSLESALHEAVNATRLQHKRIALVRLPELDAVARAHSADMASRRYFSHVSPEGSNPVDRIERGGLDGFTLAAENLGQTDEANPNSAILDGWLASADHRRNLLAPPFNATGIGIARSADGALVYTQVYVTYPR
jgi:uncharacterized protein YkwD